MPNELERLLDLANREPAYGPDFYRCMLESDVYALVPEEGHNLAEGRLRFVMWRSGDGHDAIPYFTSRAALQRALQPGWQSIKLLGRFFLNATRGATVVLNPNEPASCRLSPQEVALLLNTGAVAQMYADVPSEDRTYRFERVENPAIATLQSLSLLFARHANVLCAYVASYYPPEQPKALSYLILIRVDDRETDRLVRECAQVMEDLPPDRAMDLTIAFEDSDVMLQGLEKLGPPFYDKAWGARLMTPENTRSS